MRLEEDVLHEQQGSIGHFTGEEGLMTGVSTHIKEPDSQLKLKRRETDVKILIVQAAAAT